METAATIITHDQRDTTTKVWVYVGVEVDSRIDHRDGHPPQEPARPANELGEEWHIDGRFKVVDDLASGDRRLEPLWTLPMTDAQREQVAAVERLLHERFAEDPDAREVALAGALQVLLGARTLEESGGKYTVLQAQAERARTELTGAILASAGSEREVAERAGVSRSEVRKARGK